MKYHYYIRQVNWNDEKEKEKWYYDAVIFGTDCNYVIVETIDDTEEFSFYLGNKFFKKDYYCDDRSQRIFNWLIENHPEHLI